MTLYALDAIDDAIDATRTFLWPFDRGRWARLALVVFFLGGVGGVNPFQFAGSGGTGGGGGPEAPPPGTVDSFAMPGGPELAIIGLIVAIVVGLALLFAFVGSVMEFVFVESLRREEVTVRRYWSDHWGRGVRLFLFRLVVGVLTFGLVGLLVVAVLAPVLFGSGDVSFGLLALAIPVGIAVGIVSGLVSGFTTMFVVPVMLAEERSLLSAWRRFWPTMTGQWKQYVTYAVMGFVLQIAGGIAASIVTVVAAVVLAIPAVLLGLLGAGLLSVSHVAGWVVIGVVAALFVLALLVVGLLVTVPVQTFLRYYALFVLGDTNEAFDLIPERRRAIRE
jgi:hypothetical protein